MFLFYVKLFGSIYNSIFFGSITYGRVKISPYLNKHKLKSKHFKINVLDTF